MTGIIERLESATEGSRELDAAIAVAVRSMVTASGGQVPKWADENFPVWRVARAGVVEVVHDDGHGSLNWHAPHYTTSLDAALALVPGGRARRTNYLPAAGYPYRVWIYKDSAMPFEDEMSPTAMAKTEALALCIASRRAREQGQ
jgi:hypothetical protein